MNKRRRRKQKSKMQIMLKIALCILIILKFSGIDISWYLVFAPFWLPMGGLIGSLMYHDWVNNI